MKKIIIGLALVLFNSIWAVAYAHGPDEGYGMGPWMMHWGYGMGWWIFPLTMIIVMLILCFFLGRRGGRSSWCGFGEQKDTDTPLDILKKRYAKGEISKEEFELIKKDL
jgi:putative membrane protein